jgi:hypothetical protein
MASFQNLWFFSYHVAHSNTKRLDLFCEKDSRHEDLNAIFSIWLLLCLQQVALSDVMARANAMNLEKILSMISKERSQGAEFFDDPQDHFLP